MIADEFLSRTGLAAKLEYLENIEATIDAIHQSIPGVDEAWMRAANQLSIPWPATGTASLTAEYEGNGVATT